MPKSHTIQVSISTALAGSFKSAFKDSSGQLVRLGNGMKKLETKSKNLDRFSNELDQKVSLTFKEGGNCYNITTLRSPLDFTTLTPII